jgi:hypothetical protein
MGRNPTREIPLSQTRHRHQILMYHWMYHWTRNPTCCQPRDQTDCHSRNLTY